MSEPDPQPPTAPPPVAPRSPGRPWVLVVVVAVLSLLVGAGGATTAFLLYNRAEVPEYRFHVTVFLRPAATDAEKEELRSVLAGIDAAEGLRYESREEAYRNFRELYEDSPDLVESVRPETLPDSFRFDVKGARRTFDCGILEPLHGLPAVDEADVSGIPTDRKSSPTFVTCP